MEDVKRIMLECRYLLSLGKNYCELSKIFNIGEDIIYHDLNNKLKDYDTILYQKVQKKLRKIS